MKSSRNVGNKTLWGELPAREVHKQEVITPDIIENVWRQVTEDTNNPDCDYHMSSQSDYVQMPMGNLHVLNTINLQQQLRTMEDGTILKNLSSIENESDPEVPENPFRFLPPSTKWRAIKEYPTIELRPSTAHSVLKHAVTVLLAHIGFDQSSDVAVDTLTGVAERYLRKITLLLKIASDKDDYGFPDAVERMLIEAGVGGVSALHDYYQNYILRFEKKIKRKVEAKAEEQRQMELTACNAKMELDDLSNRFQFEELDEFGNVYREVPTLQLLDPDMGFPPSLDAGFQMLHSLEQDELNSLEVD